MEAREVFNEIVRRYPRYDALITEGEATAIWRTGYGYLEIGVGLEGDCLEYLVFRTLSDDREEGIFYTMAAAENLRNWLAKDWDDAHESDN